MKVAMTTITGITTIDLRAPTSRTLAGSDAMHTDPDYSAAYVVLETDRELRGHGMTFTLGRGNEVVLAAVKALAPQVIGITLDDIRNDMGAFWQRLANESQLRWLGPEKGVIHLATAAISNAAWDLWARADGKPVWELVADLTPDQFIACIDWRYLSDAVTEEEALDILRAQAAAKDKRKAEMLRDGYPAYITSAGWLGYPDEKVRKLCKDALADGWTAFKMKVGRDIADNVRRAALMREEIGDERQLMVDANQAWDVDEAIEYVNALQPFRPLWIEEPTSPDDVLGHAAIRRAVRPIGVATGEHAHNRVMFKQLLQAEAIDFLQMDNCRLGGLNEVLAVLLLAAKFGVPVCPHAGGIGLCEYGQHVSLIDYICVSGSLDGRMLEFADHLHEHFVHPLVVRNGRYMPPTAAGFSIEMLPASIAAMTFPTGSEWTAS